MTVARDPFESWCRARRSSPVPPGFADRLSRRLRRRRLLHRGWLRPFLQTAALVLGLLRLAWMVSVSLGGPS